MAKKKPWTQPAWMAPYVDLIGNTGGWITPEHAMNCDGRDCNVLVNSPRALLCVSVSSQIGLLQRLHKRGALAEPLTHMGVPISREDAKRISKDGP